MPQCDLLVIVVWLLMESEIAFTAQAGVLLALCVVFPSLCLRGLLEKLHGRQVDKAAPLIALLLLVCAKSQKGSKSRRVMIHGNQSELGKSQVRIDMALIFRYHG